MKNFKQTLKQNFFSHLSPVVLCGLMFLIGIAAASVFWSLKYTAKFKAISIQVKPLRQQNNPYQYINPLLGYDLPSEIKEFNEFQPLENQIEKKIASLNSSGLDNYSVYFRDLTLGRWVGINENTAYEPASMMKVVIMITYFKEAETNPSVLLEQLRYSTSTADEINEVPFETPSALIVGKTYTVDKLIEAMIISSDNGAKNVLLDNINQSDLDEIYTDLGLPNPDKANEYVISPKQYSVLLRILYNSTYLSRTYSEKALQILSQAEYSQGLIAGLPANTPTAQKFGESVGSSNPADLEITLSNCGIIYHPTHPYILCVMTKGKNISELTKTIVTISQTVWDGVNLYVRQGNY